MMVDEIERIWEFVQGFADASHQEFLMDVSNSGADLKHKMDRMAWLA